MTPVLLVGKRRLRHVAVSWAALGQAAACLYLCICGSETKTQGCIKNLVFGEGGDGLGSLSIKTTSPLYSATIEVASVGRRDFPANMRNNMKDAHNKAAEHHESAAKSHRAAADSHGKNDNAKGKEHATQAQQHAQNANEHSKTANTKSAQQK